MPTQRYRRVDSGEILEIDVEQLLGTGGEAKVYRAPGNLAAKIYHQPDPQRAAKLKLMIENPPEIPVSNQDHVMIAWPLELLADPETGEVVGYLMDRVEGMKGLIDFYNPKIRSLTAPGFHTAYLTRTARNLAVSVEAVHAMGYVIGDLNESNILAKETALITIVDMDSIQVRDPDSALIHRSVVGKIDYTAPEVQGQDFDSFDRTVEQDRFALAVLIFQLLMEGTHPFAGTPSEVGETKPLGQRIAEGLFPYHSQLDLGYVPRRMSPAIESLHPELQKLIRQCFEDGQSDPQQRPDASAWVQALQVAEEDLRICGRNPQHHFSGHQARCPWCLRSLRLQGYDAFPPRSPSQRDAPELEAAAERRNLRQRRAQQQAKLSKVAAALLPLLIIGAVSLAYSLVQDAETRAQEQAAARAQAREAESPSPGTVTANDPDEEPESSDPTPTEAGPGPTSEVAEPATPDPAASVVPRRPDRPSGGLPAPLAMRGEGLLRVIGSLGGDSGKTGYALHGSMQDAELFQIIDSEDGVWVSSDRGLMNFDPETDRWQLHGTSPYLGHSPYRALAASPEGLIAAFHGYPNGTRLITPGDSSWKEIANLADCFLADSFVVWAGMEHGLQRLDLDTGRSLLHNRRTGHLPSDRIIALRGDETAVWVARGKTGQQDGGVSRLDVAAGDWSHLGTAQGLVQQTPTDLVLTAETLWVLHGTADVSELNRQTGEWSRLRIPQPGAKSAGAIRVQHLAAESERLLWVAGGDGAGLFAYHRDTGKSVRSVRFTNRRVIDLCACESGVWAIFADPEAKDIPAVLVRVHPDRSKRRQRVKQRLKQHDLHRQAWLSLLPDSERGSPAAKDPAREAAIRAGKDWLLAHQDRNGRFDADGFHRHDPAGKAGQDAGKPGHDVAVTALALLALSTGSQSLEPMPARLRQGIEGASRWLISQQHRSSGRIGSGSNRVVMHSHPMALLALCQAYALLGGQPLRTAIDRAVRFLEQRRVKGKAWRYIPRRGDSDISISIWCVEALLAAADLGLAVDTRKLGSAITWLRALTDPLTGRTGYFSRGSPAYRPADRRQDFPAEDSTTNLAAGLYLRFLAGCRDRSQPTLAAMRKLLVARERSWEGRQVDMLDWYFSSQALWGLKDDSKHLPGLWKTLVEHQRKTGASQGSWDPIGVWGQDGGRIYSTALALLSLQAPLRADRDLDLQALSADPRLDALRQTRPDGPGQRREQLRRLGKNFRPRNARDLVLIRRADRQVVFALMDSQHQLRLASAIADPIDSGVALEQVAVTYPDLQAGKDARQQLSKLRSDPRIRDEWDLRKSLQGLREKYRDTSGARYRRERLEILAQFLHTPTGQGEVEALMQENGSRKLPRPVKKRSEASLLISSQPFQRLIIPLQSDWWQQHVPSGSHYRSGPGNRNPDMELILRFHRKRSFAQVGGTILARMNRERTAALKEGEGRKKDVVKLGPKRYQAWVYQYRRKAAPDRFCLIRAIAIPGGVLELCAAGARQQREAERLLDAARLQAKPGRWKTCQLRRPAWLAQLDLPGLEPEESTPEGYRFRQPHRDPLQAATLEFRLIPSAKTRFLDVARRERERLAPKQGTGAAKSWSASLHADGKAPLCLVQSTERETGQHLCIGLTRINDQTDLIWTYQGLKPGQKLVEALLRDVRLASINEAK